MSTCPLPVLVTISSTSGPICNLFHTKRANSGKITFLGGILPFTPLFEENSITQGHEISSQKNIVLVASHSDSSLHRFDTIAETDGRTDKHTHTDAQGQAMAKTRSVALKWASIKSYNTTTFKHSAVALNNGVVVGSCTATYI